MEEEFTLKNLDEIEKYHFPHHKFSCLLVFSVMTIVFSIAVVAVSILIIFNRNNICSYREYLPMLYGILFLMAMIGFAGIFVFKWFGKEYE